MSDASKEQPVKHSEGNVVREWGAVKEVSDLQSEKHFSSIFWIPAWIVSDASDEHLEKHSKGSEVRDRGVVNEIGELHWKKQKLSIS
jgi:hypothetical protein